MNKQEVLTSSETLVARTPWAVLGCVNPDAHPLMSGFLKLEADGLKTIWLTSRRDRAHTCALQDNPNSSLYFVDIERFTAVLLKGTTEIVDDPAIKKRFWESSSFVQAYHSEGIDDKDFVMLKFTTRELSYYISGMDIADITL
ncbi:MAG: pyridoxamine 5'-phosphate oxidase family protein [Negativicutes bacterium]|nr:pyridoxamine 5'-phosphate oxidase family protein [Negativicutes bacterium]